MQFKTLFVLSLAFSLFSTSIYADEYEYESPSFSNSYSDSESNSDRNDYSNAEFVEPINDPVFEDTNNYASNNRRKVEYEFYKSPRAVSGEANYAARLPKHISTNERVIIVNPRNHVWGAYSESGKLIRAGLATSGARWCQDIGRSCRTKTGVFRIYSLGDSNCVSSIYPVGEGGAPMPYCMFFNGGQGLHGSNHLAEGNLSHGCVRISVNEAEWIRYNFARKGTKVIIQSY